MEKWHADGIVDGKGRDETDIPYKKVIVDWCVCNILSEAIQGSGGESVRITIERTKNLRSVPPFSDSECAHPCIENKWYMKPGM